MIELSHICKNYRVAKRSSGFKEAVKAVFSRQYTTVHALTDISFSIPDGEIVGYIGPNGAGKSTTIKIMSGVLTPDSGLCNINGYIPWKNRKEYTKKIGVVFGQRSQLWWDVPVIDSFELLKEMYEIDAVVYHNSLDELVELLSLEDLLKTPTRVLSLGQRMKCEIAASLLHHPDILFLDEPTIGLDTVSKLAIRQFIKKINRERKTTVILTTHDMQDIEALAERILLIGKGTLLFEGSLETMGSAVNHTKYINIKYDGNLLTIPEGATIKKSTAEQIIVKIDTTQTAVPYILSAFSSQVEIKDISITSPSVEELVAMMYKDFAL